MFASLSHRMAVVTGASSGIGRAIALELASAGADVLLHCRASRDQAEDVAQEIRCLGCRAELVTADLSTLDGRRRLSDDAGNSELGPPEIWVNNAGADLLTGENARLSFDEKLTRLLDVDVRGTIELSRAVGRTMKERGSGVILNIGWDQAATGMEGDSGELFAAAKHAIMGFTRSLAVSLAPEVRVNCIAPGWIRTAWGEGASDEWQQRVLQETPLGRWGEPEDIAKLARFLVSDEAAYLTGQVINANGGAVR
jgi:3-oxoacyl-[acyl-carrier protein] reductase